MPEFVDWKETEKMHRKLLVCLLFLAGCGSVTTPFERRPEKVDDPLLTIGEQQRKGRERIGLPDDSSSVGPKTGSGVGR
jgi:hypothetical protein